MIQEATLLGRVGKKDTRIVKDGTEMTTIYLATNRNWTDKGGVKQEQTVWHNVNFFNRLSDIVKRHAHVGNLVYIKGEINHKKIESGDKMGQWAYSVTANSIRLLPGNKKVEDVEKEQRLSLKDELDDDIPF